MHIQAALADFIKEGFFVQHVRRMRKVYRQRRDTLEDALTQSLGCVVSVRHPAGGLQLVADLPADRPAEDLMEAGARIDMCLRPMSAYYLHEPPPNALHLGYAAVPECAIGPAVEKLAKALLNGT